MTSMRIAVYHNLEPGGAKRHLSNVLRCLKERDHKTDIYTLSDSKDAGLPLETVARNVYEYNLGESKERLLPFYSLEVIAEFSRRLVMLIRLEKLCKKIARDIDQRNYDIVYVHHCKYTQTPSLIRFLKTPSILCWHEGLRWAYERDFCRKNFETRRAGLSNLLKSISTWILVQIQIVLDRINTKAADHIVSNSYFSRETLYRVYGQLSDVIYPGIDTERFRPAAQPRENFIFSPGRIEYKKGYEWILRALAKIPAPQRPTLVLGGFLSHKATREANYLKKLAQSKEVNLQLVDLSSDEKLISHYQRALATVYLPYFEPFGLVPLESMACGTPVIGIREGGVRETILDGQVGFLVDRDENQIAHRISRLVEDKELRERMGVTARKYCVENWRYELTASRVEEFFLKCIRQTPRVSIVIPTYTRPQLLRRAIASIQAQTYKDYDVWVIQNGPYTESEEIVEGFKKEGLPIHYHHIRRADPSHARNVGISLSKGEYIAFLDDDDEWLPEKLAKQVEVLDQNPSLGWVTCQADVYGPNGEDLGRAPILEHPDSFRELVSYGNMIYSLSLTMIRRKCLDEVGLFNERYPIASDYDLYLRLARKFKFATLRERLAKYYRHAGSASNNLTWQEEIKILRKLRPEPSLEVTQELIQSHLRRLPVWLYNKASVTLNQRDYYGAAQCFLLAIQSDPFIGLRMRWSRHASQIYRLIKPYLAVIYCLGQSLLQLNRAKVATTP